MAHDGAFCSRNNTVSFNFAYDSQITILHCVNMCMDCVVNRPENWQDYCLKNTSTIPYFLLIASSLHEEIAGNILRLVCYAICGYDFKSDNISNITTVTVMKEHCETKPAILESGKNIIPNELLIKHIINYPETVVLNKYYSLDGFLTYFLLDTNSIVLRQQAQSFLWTIFTISSSELKRLFLEQFWRYC